MISANNAIKQACGLDAWHAAGYTGAGIKIAVWDFMPYVGDDMPYAFALSPQAAAPTHATRVAQCLHEAAPDAVIYMLSLSHDSADSARWILEHDIDLISCSYEPPTPNHEREPWAQLRASDIPFFAAAGNTGADILGLPAFDWVISVGAVTERGAREDYSSIGQELDCLAYIPYIEVNRLVTKLSGTSFAQPWAAGMWACYAQYLQEQGRAYDRAAAISFIAHNCCDIAAPGRDNLSGWGVLCMPPLPEIEEGREIDPEITYQYPFKGRFAFGTEYGKPGTLWRCGYHSGLDLISSNYGGDGLIYPIAPGWVDKVALSASYGNYIIIKHYDGYCSLYAHLRPGSIDVEPGDMVSLDTVLGQEGSTGNSTGTHLHIEIHKGDYRYPAEIDPRAHIDARIRAAAAPDPDPETEEDYMITTTKLQLNGVVKEVQTIQYQGHNYIKLRDLIDEQIAVDYDATQRLPILEVTAK